MFLRELYMLDVAKGIRSLHQIKREIEQHSVEGALLLVDLLDSTSYKTHNGESAWLSRLIDFQDAVKRGLSPLAPTKYLGDGVLCFFRGKGKADKVLECAKRILA